MGNNFGLAIIVFTIIMRLALLPLTLKQIRYSRNMSEQMKTLQPKLAEIQKKYAKNKQKLQQEMAKLYQEAGISPMGCLTSPMLIVMIIQIPIWMGLYYGIRLVAGGTDITTYLYSWSIVQEVIASGGPIYQLLWLDITQPDPYFAIPILVMLTMWLSFKIVTPPQPATADPKQGCMTNMMQLMMPLMMGIISISLPSGLPIYWIISGIFTTIINGFIYGWGNILSRPTLTMPAGEPVKPTKPKRSLVHNQDPDNSEGGDGKFGGKRQDSRGSRSKGIGKTQPKRRRGEF
jgi:YidC/Oxa1 family membrane protein insertase